MRPYQFGLSSIPMLKQTDEYDGMVGEVFPDAGQIRAHLDAELAQVPGRPDARPHQEHGRMHAAGGEDDLARAEFLCLAADPRADAGHAAPLEHQAARSRTIHDRQIAASAHPRVEIADRRRRALLRPVAHGHRAVAVAEIRVHVGDERDLALLRESVDRLRQRRPIFRLGAADRHRAVAAVQVAGKIQLILELAIVREHVGPAPTRRAVRLPFGVIVRRSAIRHHAHDGGAAAHDAPLRKVNRRGIVLAAPMHLEVRPEIGVVVIRGRVGIEHVGRLFARRRVRSGFEQKHLRTRARRQPVGQHASRRAAADDDGVEIRDHAARRVHKGAD